ncbi:hypothetical protein [Raineyella sp. LH-20]|uniref:hypothetical protein n=1 Tax=Raineyella sp. LH-20 TaxID=3081204 RepID=UPI002953A9C1|nr:hypothetical protein [Raineyella sp. LH-20]WOP17995.1 hypothetical protein R0146_12235 [Raineyella sp. LH-20]
MVSPTWTADFPGWEHGSYHEYPGVYRRRPDGLSIRVLQVRPPLPAPADLGGEWPAARSWLVSFWRLHDSQSFHLVGPAAADLADVLALDGVSAATMLVELNKRIGLLAWPAYAAGFEWTGELADGATPPRRAPEDWLERLLAAGWTQTVVDEVPMAQHRDRDLVVRVGVDPVDPSSAYVPQCWFLEFATTEQRPLRRVLGGVPSMAPAGELYVTPWRDSEMVLDYLATLPSSAGVDAIRSWLQASTDSAVEFVAPDGG